MTILASVNNKTLMPGITPIADVPDRPTIGTATAGEGSASVTFTASTTGGTPTTFTATSNPGSITGTASSSPITLSGLSGGTSYTFTVTAGNSTGTSPASSASNSVTPTTVISGGYDSLATVIVPSGGLSSIVFAGIPTGYKHLQLRIFAQCNRATYAGDSCLVTVNGDTGYNYPQHSIQGEGSTAAATGTVTSYNALNIRNAMGSSSGPGFAAIVVDFLDYSNTSKNKTLRFLGGHDNNGTVAGYGGYMVFGSSLWLNTNAINNFSIRPETGTLWNQHSTFSLYGVK